jgi:hypothetical protein
MLLPIGLITALESAPAHIVLSLPAINFPGSPRV